jgi:hypothetical protein
LSPQENSVNEGQFFDGGFEEDIQTSGDNFFNWQIKSEPQAQIAIDGSTPHNGARSLRILFKASSTFTFNSIAQLVVVEPATQYRFECYVRAKDLKSAGTPTLELPPIAPGTYDWQPLTVNFKTPPQTEAVLVRIGRASCGADAVCPIFGMVWYDDFNLQRLGGATTAAHDARSGK